MKIGFVFILLLFSCRGLDKGFEDLGGGYTLVLQGSGYNSVHPSYLDSTGVEISSTILDYRHDIDFITLVQQPDTQNHKWYIQHLISRNDTFNPELSHIRERMADSIFNNSEEYRRIFAYRYNYWIIDHKTKKTYGPLRSDEYLRICDSLRVPLTTRVQNDRH